VVAAFDEVRPAPLLGAVAGAFVLLALQTLRWWAVTRAVTTLGFGDAYRAMVVGYLFNVLLPARAGDLVRVQWVGARTGVERARILGTELVDFWSDKWGWIGACAIVWIVGSPPRWVLDALLLMGAVVVLVALALVAIDRNIAGFVFLARRFGIRASLVDRGLGIAADLRAGIRANGWRRIVLVQTLLAPLPWLWEAGVIGVAAPAAGFGLSFAEAFAVLTAFNLATVVPVPANAGSFEAASTVALVSFGVAPARAAVFSVAYHLSQVVPSTLAGVLVLALTSRCAPSASPDPVSVES
jgi:uncharacterized membrane protein YbhN (UPF0104 family)